MSTKLLSIECGFDVIKIVELEYNSRKKNSVKIDNIICLATPKGAVTQTGLYELETLALSIKTALTENKIKTKDCIFIINSENIHARRVTIPSQPNTIKLLEVLKATVEDSKVFPIDLQGNILSYVELEKIQINKDDNTDSKASKDKSLVGSKEDSISVENIDDILEVEEFDDIDDSNTSTSQNKSKKAKNTKKPKANKPKAQKNVVYQQSVMGFIAPESFIKSYLELGNMLNLRIKSIDYSGNSVYNFIATKDLYRTGSFLVVHITDYNCIMTTIQDGIMIGQRSTEYCYGHFANLLLSRNKLFDNVSTVDEVFQYFTKMDFFNMSDKDIDALPLTDLDKEDYAKIRDDVEDSFINLFNRISSFINQYRTTYNKNIDRIIFVNERESFPDISESIRVNTGIETETLHITDDIFDINRSNTQILVYDDAKAKYTISSEEFNLISVIGSLGSYINSVNFNILDSEFQRNKEITNRACVGILLGVATICVAYGLHMLYDYANVMGKNQKLKIDISNATQAQEIYNNFIESDYARESIETFEAQNITKLNELDIIFDNIENVVPTGLIEITSIVCDEDTITLSITAKDKDAVGQFVQSLETIQYFAKYDEEGIETTGNVDIVSMVDSYTTDDTVEREITTTIVCTFSKPIEEEWIPPVTDTTDETTSVS